MKKNFFKSVDIFLKAFPHFIIFELLFKLMLMTLCMPTLSFLLKLTMKISGINYISDEKIWIYLKNPVSLIFIVLILLFTAAFTFIEISALTGCFSCYAKNEKTTVGGMFRMGFLALKKIFKKGGFTSFLKFMAFMPLVQATLSSSVFMIPLMPILKTAFKPFGTAFAIISYAIIQILLIFLVINYCYSLHFLMLTDKNFKECTKQSKLIINSKKKEQVLSIILWNIFMIAAAALITFIISFTILLFIKGFSNPRKALLSAVKVLQYAGKIFAAVSSFLITPAIICRLTGKFFSDIPTSENIVLPEARYKRLHTLSRVIIILSLILTNILFNYKYMQAIYKGNISLSIGILTRTQITAHRGFSRIAPENTIYAFEAALESGADYIELDVQLSADEQVVVFHDEKLDRVTNGSGKLSDFTYSELQNFSAGCKFGKNNEFNDARIPLLSDVFELIRDKILFNIEIKNYGNNYLTAEKTVSLIEEYGLEDSCYITSFSYNILKEVKKINPNIKTGLISNTAVTAFSQLRYIDALSLNHIFVNSSVVNNAHQNGKRVFVWTVDNTSDMQNMIAMGVDNIITNRPNKTAEIIYSKSISNKILIIFKSIFGT